MKFTSYLVAALSGLFLTLSLAPFNVRPLAVLSGALLFYTLLQATPARASKLLLVFGLALFGSGASWVYVSIHEFGFVTAPLAVLLTALFCALLSLIHALAWLPFTAVLSVLKQHSRLTVAIFLFATTGLFAEWLRGWIFSGFPWLFAGYSQTEGPLAYWAPLGGVYLLSFIVYASGATLGALAAIGLRRLRNPAQHGLLFTGLALALVWLVSPLLGKLHWTTAEADQRKVSIVQANISQHDKWRPEMLAASLQQYRELSAKEWSESELVIWPEAAIAREYHASLPFLERMKEIAGGYSSALLTGVPYREASQGEVRTYNSVVVLGRGSGLYHKRRLVPFGEYIPLQSWFGPLMEIFELPMSGMSSGPATQPPLQIQDWQVEPLVCYEVVYPALAARAARHSDLLLSISNDAWFGRSIGPLQHLQMARMRALENGRYLLRGTGTGVSAIIGPRGELLATSDQFQAQVIRGEVYLQRGSTPWSAAGWWLLPTLNLLLMAALSGHCWRKRQPFDAATASLVDERSRP